MGRGDYLKDLGKKGQSVVLSRDRGYEPKTSSLSPRSPSSKKGDYLKDLGRKGMTAQLDERPVSRPVPRREPTVSPPAKKDPWGIDTVAPKKPTAAAPAAGAGGKAPPMTRAEVKAQIEAEKRAVEQASRVLFLTLFRAPLSRPLR